MRRVLLGIMMAAVMVGSAFAGCHSSSPRAYQEYVAFKQELPASVLAQVADVTGPLEAFFTEKYPQGKLTVDYTRADEATIAESQRQLMNDYQWLQAQLTTLRERVRAIDPTQPALAWLAHVELKLTYAPEQTDRLLRVELPRLGGFKRGSAYEKAKYDGVYAACVTSMSIAGQYFRHEPGSTAWFAVCGEIQPRDKREDGHMALTHTILDNLAAFEASRRDRNWVRM